RKPLRRVRSRRDGVTGVSRPKETTMDQPAPTVNDDPFWGTPDAVPTAVTADADAYAKPADDRAGKRKLVAAALGAAAIGAAAVFGINLASSHTQTIGAAGPGAGGGGRLAGPGGPGGFGGGGPGSSGTIASINAGTITMTTPAGQTVTVLT